MTKTYNVKKEAAKLTLAEYKKLEAGNDHSRCYEILAVYGEDREALEVAKFNTEFRNKFGYCNTALRDEAHELCNHYFALLVSDANS